MRVEPCCVPADDEALRPPSVATRALFEASRILEARMAESGALHANRTPKGGVQGAFLRGLIWGRRRTHSRNSPPENNPSWDDPDRVRAAQEFTLRLRLQITSTP